MTNIFLLAHAAEEHVREPSTLIHHWPIIFGISLMAIGIGLASYVMLREKPAREEDDI